MLEKIANFMGTVLVYSAVAIGSYEIAAFAVNRVLYIVENSESIFDNKGKIREVDLF